MNVKKEFRMSTYSDICIVGAGIGGLICASHLIDAAASR